MKLTTTLILALTSITTLAASTTGVSTPLGSAPDRFERTLCNADGHTCNGQALTSKQCTALCRCNPDKKKIECEKWSGCKGSTVSNFLLNLGSELELDMWRGMVVLMLMCVCACGVVGQEALRLYQCALWRAVYAWKVRLGMSVPWLIGGCDG